MSRFSDIGRPGDTIAGSYGTQSDRLKDFYIPMLKRASRYDRVSGYFTSHGLRIAAQGLAEFIPGGGTMRLIVGAQLDPDDVKAIEDGRPIADAVADAILSGDPFKTEDVLVRHRLDVLAWLIKTGRLWIKVGLKVRADGTPISATEDRNYFHHKFGVFTDEAGLQLAFDGSGNESYSGWVGNSESFWTVASWWGDEWWGAQGQAKVDEFERMWVHHDAGPQWTILDLPDAVHQELIRFAPSSAPTAPDPESQIPPDERDDLVPTGLVIDLPASGSPDPRLFALRDAPKNRKWTGVTTSGVELLPHQVAVVRRAVETWERGGYLFADEVGLGKTIEVGTAVRELVLSGLAKRVLLLVPAGVIGQWQEELIEKLALWVPRWEHNRFTWPDGSIEATSGPWASDHRIVLASSHLARRRAQRGEVVAAGPWDILIVDEAHHARRQGGKSNGTPNALLNLLIGLRDEHAWHTLMLASATPMQMHPHELWDLLNQFDLPGDWSDETKYESYFGELRQKFDSRQWNFLCMMLAQHFADRGAEPNPGLDQFLAACENPQAKIIRRIPRRGLDRAKAFGLDDEARGLLDAWLLANNPMRDRTFRNTRKTLRAYQAAGRFPATIPDRHVEDVFLDMTDAEYSAYVRISSYISRHYNAALAAGGATRRGLGFIMTVYRRRLTSSFEAIKRSLQRRADVLAGRAESLLTDDDLTLFDDTPDEKDLAAAKKSLIAGEVQEIESFLAELDNLALDETKILRLTGPTGLINQALREGHSTILIFSQYADTVDYIRERLDQHFRGRVLAYTGKGGLRRDPGTGEWVAVDKQTAKDLFREGKEIQILVGTDSLSEGLNLQTCGFVLNYDMPWNFIRVEQRIGRVDRIGGLPRVEVRNLFYNRTVEANIYKAIATAQGGFDWIVGEAQPVLGSLEGLIESAALAGDDGQPMLGPEVAPTYAQQVLSAIQTQVAESQAQAIRLDMLDEERGDFVRIEPHWGEALTLDDVLATLLEVPATAQQLSPHSTWDRVYTVADAAGVPIAVTFDRATLDKRSPKVRLLSYGDPLFDLVLARAGVDAETVMTSKPELAEPPALTIAEQTGALPLGDTL